MSEIILNSFPSMDELKDKATLVGFIAGVVTGALITRLMIGPSDDDWEDIEEEESDDEDEDEEDEASPVVYYKNLGPKSIDLTELSFRQQELHCLALRSCSRHTLEKLAK
eukprot:m.27731 g.27731  ORF g.27731 m.27731 type:complete len:110 (+) comp7926_c1_seq2:216-545(+)